MNAQQVLVDARGHVLEPGEDVVVFGEALLDAAYRLGFLSQAVLDGLDPVKGHFGGLLLDLELDAEAPEILGALVHVGGELVALPVGEFLHLLERAVVSIELAVDEDDHQDQAERDEVSHRKKHAGKYSPFPGTEEVRYPLAPCRRAA